MASDTCSSSAVPTLRGISHTSLPIPVHVVDDLKDLVACDLIDGTLTRNNEKSKEVIIKCLELGRSVASSNLHHGLFFVVGDWSPEWCNLHCDLLGFDGMQPEALQRKCFNVASGEIPERAGRHHR